MNKTLAKDLVHILPGSYDILNEYVNYRISMLHSQLERAKDLQRIAEIQGAIDELRLLSKLRETAVNVLKVEHYG